jgi:hypothetical protein
MKHKHLIDDVLTQRREEDLSTPVEVCEPKREQGRSERKIYNKTTSLFIVNTESQRDVFD